MDPIAIDRQQRARDWFFDRADRPRDIALPQEVDPALLRGWQRCRDYGLSPERPVVFRAVQSSRVRASRELHHGLRTVAVQELVQLGRALAASGAAVILTDPHLMILDVLGRSDRMGREMRSLAREGVDLSERVVGSNALSLAAIERTASIVLNNGHFFDANAVFACAAAPLLSPTGDLLGILDVTTCRDRLPAEAPFLVSAAAKAIENALFWQNSHHLIVRFHPRADFVDTALGAVIACTVDGDIVGANQIALQMLDLKWPLNGARFDRCFRQRVGLLLSEAGRLDRFSIDLMTQAGAAVFARVRMPGRAAAFARSDVGTGRTAAWDDAPRLASASPVAGPLAGTIPSADRAAEAGRVVDPSRSLADWPTVAWPPASWIPDSVARQGLPACLAGLPLLLVGESGVGKTLSATWLLRMSRPAVKPTGREGDDERRPTPWIWHAPTEAPDWDAMAQAVRRGDGVVLDAVDRVPASLHAALAAWLDRLSSLRDGNAEDGAPAAGVIATATATAPLEREPALWHRLGGLRLTLPALRDRPDREALIDDGLCTAVRRARSSAPPPVLTLALRQRLLAHPWPGHLRELGGVCRYLAIRQRAAGELTLDDLPPGWTSTPVGPDRRARDQAGEGTDALPPLAADAGDRRALPDDEAPDGASSETTGMAKGPAHRLREWEQRAIEQALSKHQGNLSSAARELGVSRGTLYRRLRAGG